jgi:hypothetical protein
MISYDIFLLLLYKFFSKHSASKNYYQFLFWEEGGKCAGKEEHPYLPSMSLGGDMNNNLSSLCTTNI